MPKTKSHSSYLLESLQDPTEAALYLEAALEEEDFEFFCVALHNVVEAQLALLEETSSPNDSLLKARQRLDQQPAPDFFTLTRLLSELGFKISVMPREQAA